jgi:hypothetical protein
MQFLDLMLFSMNFGLSLGNEREENYQVDNYLFDCDSEVDVDKISLSDGNGNVDQNDLFDLDDEDEGIYQNLHHSKHF